MRVWGALPAAPQRGTAAGQVSACPWIWWYHLHEAEWVTTRRESALECQLCREKVNSAQVRAPLSLRQHKNIESPSETSSCCAEVLLPGCLMASGWQVGGNGERKTLMFRHSTGKQGKQPKGSGGTAQTIQMLLFSAALLCFQLL